MIEYNKYINHTYLTGKYSILLMYNLEKINLKSCSMRHDLEKNILYT